MSQHELTLSARLCHNKHTHTHREWIVLMWVCEVCVLLCRSARTHPEGGGGRDPRGHFQEHGDHVTQPPPTRGRLREAVRGWVSVTWLQLWSPGDTAVPQCVSVRVPAGARRVTHSKYLHRIDQHNKQRCLSFSEILTRSGRFSESWSPTGHFAEPTEITVCLYMFRDF